MGLRKLNLDILTQVKLPQENPDPVEKPHQVRTFAGLPAIKLKGTRNVQV